MRLGFITARSGHFDGGLWCDAGVGRLVDALRERADQFVCALAPPTEHLPKFDHYSDLAANQFKEFPSLPGFVRGFHKVGKCRNVIRAVEAECDVVLVQLPFLAPLALSHAHTPRVYHVFGDVLEMARLSPAYCGIKRPAALAVAHGIDFLHQRLFQQPSTAVVTHGEELFRRYGVSRGRTIVSSSVSRDEIASEKRKRPAKAPFRILYVGYLRPEKGIDILLKAYDSLLDDVPDAELHIVGAKVPEKSHSMQSVFDMVSRAQERGSVKFLGHLPFGPPLFQCYADADILALPSRSEGTPRVLMEARSFGCPVVASSVGGIPYSVTDGADGLLVPPDDPETLKKAMLKLVGESQLRNTLVQGGYMRAKKTTVETFADALFEEAFALL